MGSHGSTQTHTLIVANEIGTTLGPISRIGGLWVAKVAARLALGFDQGVYRVGLIVNNRRPVDARSPRVEMGAHP